MVKNRKLLAEQLVEESVVLMKMRISFFRYRKDRQLLCSDDQHL